MSCCRKCSAEVFGEVVKHECEAILAPVLLFGVAAPEVEVLADLLVALDPSSVLAALMYWHNKIY